MDSPVPIILLHHNEFDFLERSVSAIYTRTLYPYKLCIVDNLSRRNDSFWNDLTSRFDLEVIFNKNNNWIYGFNLAKHHFEGEFIVLSDADIVVPAQREGICWMSHLVDQMRSYPYLGKLGLSLDLTYLRTRPDLSRVLDSELTFKRGAKVGSNVISPVDSTLAIYRSDVFICSFKMQIGHQRLIRPYYLTARTSDTFECEHLGWTRYETAIEEGALVKTRLIEKARFFGLYGISLPLDLFNALPSSSRLRYVATLNVVRACHSVKIYLLWLTFAIKTFPKSCYIKSPSKRKL
jgi:hypothetical protein